MCIKLKNEIVINKKSTSTFTKKVNKDYKIIKNKNFENNNMYSYGTMPLPFEKEYHTKYNQMFLSKLKNKELYELNINNFSNKKKNDYNNYLTVRNNKNIFSIKNNFKKCKSRDILDEENILINKIFPDNKELNKYSNVPFFFLTRKPLNFSDDKKLNIKLLKEDFIYKISHGDKFYTHNINNNFIRNKSIKKGLTIDYMKEKNMINNKLSLPDIKLELDINNLSNGEEKRNQLMRKEKYLFMLKNKLKDFKNGNVFKKLEEDILNFNELNEISKINNEKNLDEKDENSHINNKKNESIRNKTTLKKTKSYTQKPTFNNNIFYNDSHYFVKKPLKYSINFYSNKQLEIKKKRYEKTHKEGWKEFKRKINIRNLHYNSNKNVKNPMVLCVLEPNRDLQKKKITNKIVYQHESKMRDILISNKLKFEFSKDDIKRILNGQKPWKDFDFNKNDNDNENEQSKRQNNNKIKNIKKK